MMALAPILENVRIYLASGGGLMPPLVLVSICIWYAYLTCFLRLRESLGPAASRDLHLDEHLRTDNPEILNSKLAEMPGAIPRLARHSLIRHRAGLPLHEACTQCRHSELEGYQHGLILLAALVAAAPLLGLLGTVLGMIETFDAVSSRAEGSANLVAGGISKALITTQFGLLSALPGTLGLAHVYRLYQRLVNALDLCESQLSLVFEHGRKAS